MVQEYKGLRCLLTADDAHSDLQSVRVEKGHMPVENAPLSSCCACVPFSVKVRMVSTNSTYRYASTFLYYIECVCRARRIQCDDMALHCPLMCLLHTWQRSISVA